ncbi:MAG: hypothetical protein L3J32_08850 [Rhizobiaceae bacterium]|nr:hypothetical protein [Rhizobiaceae bacterium]
MLSTIKMFVTLGVLVTAPLLLSTVFAVGQSFSCAKAHSQAEFAICNNEELLSLDEKLASMYDHRKANLQTAPQRQKITREHSVWLRKRNSCDLDWSCLKDRYQERIRQLTVTL